MSNEDHLLVQEFVACVERDLAYSAAAFEIQLLKLELSLNN